MKTALSEIPITLSPKKNTQCTALTSHNLLQLYTLHIHSPQSHIQARQTSISITYFTTSADFSSRKKPEICHIFYEYLYFYRTYGVFRTIMGVFPDYKNALICEQLPNIPRLSDNSQYIVRYYAVQKQPGPVP